MAWDKAGNIYVADGIGTNNRVAKFDKDGKFITQWGSTGTGPGQFTGVKAIAVSNAGDVYVADAGNKRIQVFDGDGKFKSEFGNVGTPLTMCMTRGATQYLYISHAGDEDGMDDAAIYKTTLDGKVVGKFGIGRQAAEGVRPRELDRLPQRERTADRRDDELARPEGLAEVALTNEHGLVLVRDASSSSALIAAKNKSAMRLYPASAGCRPSLPINVAASASIGLYRST